MFNTSKNDMDFFEADHSGITHDPHPHSSTKPGDRVFYLMHKATVDCLAGSHLTIAAQKFQLALKRRIGNVPVHDEWVEMGDLYGFLRPIISGATIEAMCGAQFLERFPHFVDNFWNFNSSMPRLLQGWPRWIMPRAWRSRDRCIAIMKEWRKTSNMESFDGNAMIPRRWQYFSKMENLSEDGVACSDLGILWGMNSNSMPATFWLLWHMMADPSLLARATTEANDCRLTPKDEILAFDTTRLCNKPLLQSSYAETLRKYVAVYIIRKPIHEGAQVLNYTLPKDQMMVISSAMAHMDKRNWNVGTANEHPVESFWPDRFLTDRETAASAPADDAVHRAHWESDTRPSAPPRTASSRLSPGPKFSLNGYSGAWIPFGGGIHQCPGRHWVKLQMLLSLAMINDAFEIKLLGGGQDVGVDTAKYGLGALQPSERVRFMIKRKAVTV
ncbi:MAG: hypothetical protein Q9183_001382 [Haloplaca sp. 2 TL-2023]